MSDRSLLYLSVRSIAIVTMAAIRTAGAFSSAKGFPLLLILVKLSSRKKENRCHYQTNNYRSHIVTTFPKIFVCASKITLGNADHQLCFYLNILCKSVAFLVGSCKHIDHKHKRSNSKDKTDNIYSTCEQKSELIDDK